ncbi:arginine deiminase [Salipaludibacillus sp. CUR1]|uniref:arginine deiminase n=1 Tax=Salipaludibacillus sp. CUR1 TaxID=2820003 RepID=UPI001E48D47A|nr:arginine deiminase [Salipaludibacillus sp. CUR1]MCE7792030.1 arginine deiminase [Salipaludibacillus sp. CUR1]
MTSPFNIYSEIGTLEKVIIHRPGKEIENIYPDYLEALLFDDIPNLRVAQKEHDQFAKALQSKGAEVLYLTDLATEALKAEEVKKAFIKDFIKLSQLTHQEEDKVYTYLYEYLADREPEELVNMLISGIRKEEVKVETDLVLPGLIDSNKPFYIDPLPNMYFTRDPASIIGHGISYNRMDHTARKNETLFMKYITAHHPLFSDSYIPQVNDDKSRFPIEGGDILVLSQDTLAIGLSARTSPEAIEILFKKLRSMNSPIKQVIAVEIPKKRAFMHLDTVFTQLDTDKFTVHPAVMKIADEMNLYILRENSNRQVEVERKSNLIETLKSCLHLNELELIPVGDGQVIEAAREQWNDGSNTFALAPGTVVAYDRNYVTNDTLKSYGLDVIEVPSSELARGRGGPRCMTMPISRKNSL